MITFNDKQFIKDMNNIVRYSYGFLQGVEKGKPLFFENVGRETIELLKQYIDASARMNPDSLHHVYEWYQTGSPGSRLFNLKFNANPNGITFMSEFTQSKSLQNGATVPFYNKAKIMEDGISVTVKPRTRQALKFTDSLDNDVFIKGEVKIDNPGGDSTKGSFGNIIDEFFNLYFSQSFLNVLGLSKELADVSIYKKQLDAGKKFGKNAGIAAGYKWITNIGAAR